MPSASTPSTMAATASALSRPVMAGAAATTAGRAATGAGVARGTAGAAAAVARGAAAAAAGAATGAAAGAPAAGAAAATAGAGLPAGPPGGRVGSLIVGAAVGFGGKVMRTVSFLGWTLPVSFFGGTAPPGRFGMFSGISSMTRGSLRAVARCVKSLLQHERPLAHSPATATCRGASLQVAALALLERPTASSLKPRRPGARLGPL